MAIETVPFDPAEHLGSAERQAELLADAFASGDPSYIANALGIVPRARHDCRCKGSRRHS